MRHRVSRHVCEEPEEQGARTRSGQGSDKASGGDVQRNDHGVKDCSRPLV
jgi:hypothetical protein